MAKPKSRSCQPCTACCDGWLRIRIGDVPVYPGKPCPHSTGSGCGIYAERPVDPCVSFICGWKMEGSPLPQWMQPHNARVIFLPDQDHWRGMPVDIAVPVGKRIPPRAVNWLTQFAKYNNRGLLYGEQLVGNGAYTGELQWYICGPPEFQKEMGVRLSFKDQLPMVLRGE